MGPPGYLHSPVLVVTNIDVRQPILRQISSADGIYKKNYLSFGIPLGLTPATSMSSTVLVVQGMAFISTSDMSIPAQSLEILCLSLTGTFLSQMTPVTSLHSFQANRTLFVQSVVLHHDNDNDNNDYDDGDENEDNDD